MKLCYLEPTANKVVVKPKHVDSDVNAVFNLHMSLLFEKCDSDSMPQVYPSARLYLVSYQLRVRKLW